MTNTEKLHLQSIEDKLHEVVLAYGHTADIRMVNWLYVVQSMLVRLRTADEEEEG